MKVHTSLNAFSFAGFSLKVIELKDVYCQKDDEFLEILNAIRDKVQSEKHLKKLNERVIPDFVPPKNDMYIYLTTTNAMADRINSDCLRVLRTRSYFLEGIIDGNFKEKDLPTKQRLDIKFGSQVMLLNNDPDGKWINGSVGKVVSVKAREDELSVVNVELSNGEVVEVIPFKWEVFRVYYNEEEEKLESESVGSFTQYPIRLAWAITIHKSQGQTFNKVILDIGAGTFAHGQLYVALSRCVSLEGLVLKKPILMRHVLLDHSVLKFIEKHVHKEECLSAVDT